MDISNLIAEYERQHMHIRRFLHAITSSKKYGFCLGKYQSTCMSNSDYNFYAALFCLRLTDLGAEMVERYGSNEGFRVSVLEAIETSEALQRDTYIVNSRSRLIHD